MSPMMSSFWRFLTVLAALFSICLGGTQLEFTSSPQVITTGITKSVQLHCGISNSSKRAEYSPEDLDSVAIVSVANKEGKTVAKMHAGGAQVLVTTGGLTATGSLTGSAHLTLTFTNPAEMETGVYKCTMIGFSTNHHSVNLEKTWNVRTAGPSISDVVTQLNNAVAKLQEKNSQQDQDIDRLKTCTKQHVGFTAALDKADQWGRNHYSKGTTITWSRTITSVGGGWDGNTFTCSVPGLYRFQLNQVAFKHDNAALQIVLNGNVQTTSMAEGDDWNSGSTSVVLELRSGDKVKVIAGRDSGMASQHAGLEMNVVNIFSGNLIVAEACY